MNEELTTYQAADFLGVSRSWLLEQLEKGLIPFYRVETVSGSHRRIKIEDLVNFKETIDKARMKTLDELTVLDQELGLYD